MKRRLEEAREETSKEITGRIIWRIPRRKAGAVYIEISEEYSAENLAIVPGGMPGVLSEKIDGGAHVSFTGEKRNSWKCYWSNVFKNLCRDSRINFQINFQINY